MMVLERPMPSQCLYEFIKNYKGSIGEDLARFIMRQATSAAQTCCQRGVLHRDIKAENILINPSTLEVKLIDFRCGDFLTEAGYTSFAGTKQYCPPEYLMTSRYHGESATVWSLRILLFVILFQKTPNRRDLCKMEDYIRAKDGLSQECCNFICCCVQIDPKQRIELEKLSLHNWFMDGYPKPVPLEVALLIRVNQGPRVPEIIQLLDWQEELDCYIMVLERPMPSEELDWFVLSQTANTEEDLAWISPFDRPSLVQMYLLIWSRSRLAGKSPHSTVKRKIPSDQTVAGSPWYSLYDQILGSTVLFCACCFH
ncbi:serine/threonine-protein kinase pim-2-like [Sinocyclocheilus anshuiensis]|uniref:serine/threonine-protein kinase pim-2-like n=1 Tax=Sinocyclocheilus anshuiensis TaxID=1608454 RepID=UPI0007BA539C|nr:PREDICTED: serine/threonine-protein kinase pim-2-like [Sinocyclocheilus anshuiensis]